MNGKMRAKPYKSPASTDTINLTEAGEKLLEALKIPELRVQSVTAICQHAGISRDSFYRIWKTPEFTQKYKELCTDTLLSFALPASEALGEAATMKDVNAIKMILEMSGIYSPKASVDVTHTVNSGPSLKEILARRELKGGIEL